jgi:hypothetical protein
MLFLICCGWIVTSVLGYVLTRRDFTRHGITWLNRDRVVWLVVGALLGPVLLITALVLLFDDLGDKAFQGWFNRPSRW